MYTMNALKQGATFSASAGSHGGPNHLQAMITTMAGSAANPALYHGPTERITTT